MEKNRILKNAVISLGFILIIFAGGFVYSDNDTAFNSKQAINNVSENSFLKDNSKDFYNNLNNQGFAAATADNASKKKYVVPSGKTFGVKMYTEGLLIVDTSKVLSKNNVEECPSKAAGIKKGDIILTANGKKMLSCEEFSALINSSNGNIKLLIKRDDTKFNTVIKPVYSGKDNSKKIGLWIIDSTAGIGTMTFYNPQTMEFGALGHAITNSDTGKILDLSHGTLSECKVTEIKKGESGEAGELIGSFMSGETGVIEKNNGLGLYGRLNETDTNAKLAEVASRYEVKEGKATILCDVDGLGVKEYTCNVLKVSKSAKVTNKGIVIEITDKALLDKTGGIVQGMSGTPILQNGKIIGAITHVFVNEPKKGYAIFIENMLDQIK